MKQFQILLCIMIIGILAYTGVVGFNHGWNLLPIFFGDIIAMNWQGQFNFDFTCFLILSGLWVAWRNQFSPTGIAIGMVAFFGGIMFLAPYLLYTSFKNNGNMQKIFFGSRAKS